MPTKASSQSLGQKIGVASLIVMASVFLSRILGQVRQSYIAYVGGVGSDVDAYTIAFQLPDILNHVIAGGFLSVTFIPIFAAHLEKKDLTEGWRVFSIVITVCGSILVLLTAIAMIYTPTLVSWVAPGYANQVETLQKAIRMTRIILPAQTFFFLGGIFMAVQYAQGRFFIPAMAPLIYNLGIIFGGVVFSQTLGIEGFSWGVLGGAFLGQFVLQAFGAAKVKMRFRPAWQISHPDFKTFVYLTIPLILGLGMTFSMEFFFKFFGSMLEKGTVSSLNYALRVDMLLVALFGQAAGVASFPFLARLYAKGSIGQLVSTLDQTIRRYICLAIFASALMIVLAREIVIVLFYRGAFSLEDVATTTQALQVFLSGAFAMAAVNIIVRGFYATKNTWLPAIFGTLAVVLSIPLYWLFSQTLAGTGVALGVSVSALLQAVILYTVWNRRINNQGSSTYLALGKSILIALPLATAAWFLRCWLIDFFNQDSLIDSLIVCTLVGVLFLMATIYMAKAFKVVEITQIVERILVKIKK
jgi:putative peptidoglycan lipid II flippase